MSNILTFDFSVDRKNNIINVKREFAAERALVWEAFTKKEILNKWWAPKPWKARTKSMDFKEGGTWLYAMLGPEGEEHWSMFKYQTIDAPNRFTGIDGFTDANGVVNKEMPQMYWEFIFSGQKEHTLVEMTIKLDNSSGLETILNTGFKEGFTVALNGLDDLLPDLKSKQDN